MAIKSKEEMFGDGGGFGPAVPFSVVAPGGHSAGNRGIAFGEQLTAAVANRTHYALALNDEDLDARVVPFESDGLDAAYRLGALAVPGGGREIDIDGGAVRLTIPDTGAIAGLATALETHWGEGSGTRLGSYVMADGRRAHLRPYIRVPLGITDSITFAFHAESPTFGRLNITDVIDMEGWENLLPYGMWVEIVTGANPGLYRLVRTFDADNRVFVRAMNGSVPAFPTSGVGTLRFYNTHFTGQQAQTTAATAYSLKDVHDADLQVTPHAVVSAGDAADSTGLMIFSPERDTQAALRVFRANGGYAQEVVSIQNGLLKGRRIHATTDFGLVGTTEVTYANASGFTSPRTRQIYLHPGLFVPTVNPAGNLVSGHAWSFSRSDPNHRTRVQVTLDSYLRTGMVVTAFRVLWHPGDGRSGVDAMGVTAGTNTGRSFNPGTPAVGSIGSALSQDDDSFTLGGVLHVTEVTGLAWVIDGNVRRTLEVRSGVGDTDTDLFYGIELTVQDPGPRNY
jgi:hypothetical protein